MNRLAMAGGFFAGLLCAAWHGICGSNLLYLAWTSLLVTLLVAIALRLAMQRIRYVLEAHVMEQKRRLDDLPGQGPSETDQNETGNDE